MIEHLVLIKTTQEATKLQITTLLESLVALKHSIAEIIEISAGENYTARNCGFNIGVRVLLGSKEDVDTYRAHPNHVRVLDELIKPILKELIVLDYEVKNR